jgi:iron complex transport system substrate-binding protein
VIAAEQNQEMQEVSASTITTASENDYVLGIYGNANEDDTIDMRDLTYVKLIFFGKRPETELADAKYDDKINPLDFIQIKLIIVGKEKELTLVDSTDRIVTVKKPVGRILPSSLYDTEAMRMIGVKDKIVGVFDSVRDDEAYYQELSKLPYCGSVFYSPDYEKIVSLKPDLVTSWSYYVAQLETNLPDSIPIAVLQFWEPADVKEELMKLGYILDKKDEAEHYNDDFRDKYIDLIKARTEGLSEEERPKVYVESWSGDYKTHGSESHVNVQIDRAGGRNIFVDIPKPGKIDPEEVMIRNPDIIVRSVYRSYVPCSYSEDDPAEVVELRNKLMNRLELANVNAVKNDKVYIMDQYLHNGLSHPISIVYWAKLFHPDLFEDLDPEVIHQEYLREFQGLDYDLNEHGVFLYPPIEINGGLAGIPDKYKGRI